MTELYLKYIDEDKESSLNPTNTEAVQTENITDNGQTNAGAIISNFIPVQKQNEGPEEKLNVKNCDFKALTDDQMITMQKRNDCNFSILNISDAIDAISVCCH